MAKTPSCSNPELPPVFRVLIVDDQIGQEKAFQEQIRNTIDYWAHEASEWRSDLTVEVLFESSSVTGFNRWCNEVFDVALIDSDFSRNIGPSENESSFDLSKFVTNTAHQGFEVLRMILDKENPSSGNYEKIFNYRKEANQIFLWSGLPFSPGLKDLFTRYGLGDPLDSEIFIPKDPVGELEKVKNTVESVVKEGVERLLNPETPLTPEHQLERVLYFLSRSDLCERLPFFIGKFIFRDDENKYNTKYARLGDEGITSVFRISEHLPGDLGNDTAWLPLHGGVAGRYGLTGAVRYMHDPESNKAMKAEYDKLFDDAAKEERLRRPRYPERKKTSSDETTTVLGLEFKNPYFAAATPLTGTTVVGEKNALDAMNEKVKALLQGPFGAVILKTAYLDYDGQWENVQWPAIQMQSHMRTRCLFPPSGTSTLWNTGRTAMEMFPPQVLNRLLKSLLELKVVKDSSHRVIVSLGSKFTLPRDWSHAHPIQATALVKGIWSQLFQDVFGSGKDQIDEKAFPIVEVNARHTLRELVERQGRGDEYLSPLKLDGDAFDRQDPILDSFLQWLQAIHEVAVENRKQLIIKLPYRSDVFAFIKCAIWVRRVHLDTALVDDRPFGVRALTLINTIKSPVWPVVARHEYRQSWYASPTSWRDAADKLRKYQMSGALLSAYRGQVLAPLLEQREQLGDLEILIGGGVTDHTVLDRCLQDYQSALAVEESARRRGAVQIGTWALLNMLLDTSSWKQAIEPQVSGGALDPADFEIRGCNGCGTCSLEAAPDHDQYIVRNEEKRVQLRPNVSLTVDQIRSRFRKCQRQAVRLVQRIESQEALKTKPPATNEIRPRFAWLDQTRCRACGSCSRTFYCDAFLDRKHEGLLPVFEPRHCTGCGLCTQICPHGALHLYEPSEYLMVVSHPPESKNYLTARGIPHMYFDATDDLAGIFPDKLSTMECLLKERLKNVHALGQGAGRQYTDDRERLLKEADKRFIEGNPEGEQARALIWSLLLWSDPGHVLWESPIVTIRASGQKADITHKGRFVKEDVTAETEEALWENLLELEAIKPVIEALDKRRSSARDRI